MKKFIIRICIFTVIALISSEVFCRLIVDPPYFYLIDTYNLKVPSKSVKEKLGKIWSSEKTANVDLLFIGSSRVAASINPQIFMQKDPSQTVVVAGRGYTTAGFHYQALRNRISEFPEYLENANVFIEYAGSKQYANPFIEERYRIYEPTQPDNDKAMPHLLLPHLNYDSLLEFMKTSPNSWRVKRDMALLYFSSLYRSLDFVKEQLHRLDAPLMNATENLVPSEGGIRNDRISLAKEGAIVNAKRQIEKSESSPLITTENLKESSLAYLNAIIKENGGKLLLYRLPVHSVQERIYDSDKERINRKIFEQWLGKNDIEIVHCPDFNYEDSDFPDTWHLSVKKRDEFSLLLYGEIKAKLY